MPDYRGFDATDPLGMPNLARYDWAAIYVHGRQAYRILPESEQAGLPKGLGLLPISVISYDSPSGPLMPGTASQGQSDGADYVRVLQARGWGPGTAACIDFESGVQAVPGGVAYANAMGGILRRAGYLHFPYARTEMLDLITEKDGAWLTYWTGTDINDGLTQYWRAVCPAFAIQDGETVAGADLDYCTAQFLRALRGAEPMQATSTKFPNGFTAGGGFYQAWSHNGGLVAFGMAISQEYDTTALDGQPVRRQWFERAIFEWRANQWPANWDTEIILTGSKIAAGSSDLARLTQDALAHAAAFKPA